jgi:hypothetical protein
MGTAKNDGPFQGSLVKEIIKRIHPTIISSIIAKLRQAGRGMRDSEIDEGQLLNNIHSLTRFLTCRQSFFVHVNK